MPTTLCKMSDGGDRVLIRMLTLPYVRKAFVSANSLAPHPQGGLKTAGFEMTLVVAPKGSADHPVSLAEIVSDISMQPCVTSIRMDPTPIRLNAEGKNEYVRAKLVVGLTEDFCAKCNNISCDVTETNDFGKARRKGK